MAQSYWEKKLLPETSHPGDLWQIPSLLSFHISQAAFPCINLPFSCLLIKARLNSPVEKESRCWGKPQSRTGRNSQKEKAPWLDKDLRTIFQEGREKENAPFFSSLDKCLCLASSPKCRKHGVVCMLCLQYFACASCYLVVQHRKSRKINADNLKINLQIVEMKFLCCQQLSNKQTSTPNKPSPPSHSAALGRIVCQQPETQIHYCHYCRYQLKFHMQEILELEHGRKEKTQIFVGREGFVLVFLVGWFCFG